MKSNILSVYGSSGKKQFAVDSHTHEYWQLEIITQGVVHSGLLSQPLALQTGDMLLIPPGWPHEFTYDRPDLTWITLKFERQDDDTPVWGGHIHGNMFTSRLISSFRMAIPGTAYKDYEKAFVNGFLETMFRYVQSDDFHKADDLSYQLVKLITEKVMLRNGRAITINELAEELSYTRSHISKRFKEITGWNLKAYIDQVRVQKVEEMLRYREHSISEIALDLGFNDLFSFSKFYKKHTGASPRQFRKKAASQPMYSADEDEPDD